MTRYKLTAILAALLCAVSAFASREVRGLNSGWSFRYEGCDSATLVDLPHDYLIGLPWVAPSPDEMPDNDDKAANFRSRLSARAFKEPVGGRYTLEFFAGEELRGRRVLLDFEGIMLTGKVWLNGEPAGKTHYGYLGFDTDVSRLLRYGATNTLEVEASTGEPQNSRWYTGGGLYRPVKLVATSPNLYFERHGLWVTTPEVSAGEAKVVVNVETRSRTKDSCFLADIRLLAPDGTPAFERRDTVRINRKWKHREYALDTITLPAPTLWDIDSPALYTASVALRRPGAAEAEDSLAVRFGIRTAEFTPEQGFLLNGKKLLLKGIANHHTLGALGAAAYPRAIEKRLRMLKEFGFNHVRTSHNPYSTEFLDLCDSLGIVVVDELYDKWLRQYSGGEREWTAQWQEDIPEWVRRDRNHPSVVLWSLGNELQGYSNLPFNDWGVTAYRLQKLLLERYDPTRKVTVAMHPRYRSIETDSLPAPLVEQTDVASYNYRYMYFPGDSRRYPWMVFYQSEASRAAMGQNFFEPDSAKVAGLAYWGMIDYLGESAGWPAKGWTQGVFDLSLRPKPQAWLVKSMFSAEPTIHIGVNDANGETYLWNDEPMSRSSLVDHWNFSSTDTLSVEVFSNADEVELRLNGRPLGRKANRIDTPSERNKFRWDSVAYRPGRLEAVGYYGGRPLATHRLETAGKPVRLVAEEDDRLPWLADGADLKHI
nr:glycoside hydrolase family 2 protein [Muribaculaceae bacterium]